MLRANNKPEALNAMIERNVLRRVGKADEIAAEADLASGSWSKSFIAEHEQNDFVYHLNCSVRSVAPVSLGEHVRQHNRGGGHKRVGLTGKA